MEFSCVDGILTDLEFRCTQEIADTYEILLPKTILDILYLFTSN